MSSHLAKKVLRSFGGTDPKTSGAANVLARHRPRNRATLKTCRSGSLSVQITTALASVEQLLRGGGIHSHLF